MSPNYEPEEWDYVVIGSGFGGSVSAMRLAEKGYKVLVIEKGKKWTAKDFPKSNWNVRKYLWAPLIRCFGFQKLTFFKQLFVLSGVGLGGGSLVYANTHMTPDTSVFKQGWSQKIDWEKDFFPYYETAKYMLGTTLYPKQDKEDFYLQKVAEQFGMAHTFANVPVGVYLGNPNNSTDPYFNGHGPLRNGCTFCAGCMVGCRHNAKNSLDKNYLFFAQYYGARILTEFKVVKITFDEKQKTYFLHIQSIQGSKKMVIKTKGLVVSGGVLGTMELLLAQKYHYHTLPKLSDTLGYGIRTNSEMICGVVCTQEKLNNGVAITSVCNVDKDTHVEVVKYPDGSGLMGRLAVLATGNAPTPFRILKLFANIITKPLAFLKTFFNLTGASNTVILLVMQSLDSTMKMQWRKGLFKGIRLYAEKGQKVPAYIEQGQQAMKAYANHAKGIPMNALTEVLFNMTTTAHILGGAPMGDSPETSLINEHFQVHNYPNFYILDGSVIQSNLGVNPSLTITALAEFAMSKIPPHPLNTNIPLHELVQNPKNPS